MILQPNEFIKKYGIEKAKELVKGVDLERMTLVGIEYTPDYISPRAMQDMLKSHEYINSEGGIEKTIRAWLECDPFFLSLSDRYPDAWKLVKAMIYDVQSCI